MLAKGTIGVSTLLYGWEQAGAVQHNPAIPYAINPVLSTVSNAGLSECAERENNWLLGPCQACSEQSSVGESWSGALFPTTHLDSRLKLDLSVRLNEDIKLHIKTGSRPGCWSSVHN